MSAATDRPLAASETFDEVSRTMTQNVASRGAVPEDGTAPLLNPGAQDADPDATPERPAAVAVARARILTQDSQAAISGAVRHNPTASLFCAAGIGVLIGFALRGRG